MHIKKEYFQREIDVEKTRNKTHSRMDNSKVTLRSRRLGYEIFSSRIAITDFPLVTKKNCYLYFNLKKLK